MRICKGFRIWYLEKHEKIWTPTDNAKSLAKQTRDLNKEKKSANKALDDNVNSAINKGAIRYVQEKLEEERNKETIWVQ